MQFNRGAKVLIMLTKNEIKLIRQLKTKKFRDKHNLFVAEGEKLVRLFINSGWEVDQLYYTSDSTFNNFENGEEVDYKSLLAATHLDSPNTVLAVFKKQIVSPLEGNTRVLVLDDVRDPGNLGTIIRLADWFGVRQVICSKQTVDLYNSKVVHSTMGSMSTVSVVYMDVVQEISSLKGQGYSIIGTLMNGTSSNGFVWPEKHVLVLGNEANGISEEVKDLLDIELTIPKSNTASAESLNVAMATAVLLGSGGVK